jgi:hypothetical protein
LSNGILGQVNVLPVGPMQRWMSAFGLTTTPPPSDQPKSNLDQSWFLYYHLKNKRFMAIPMSATARLSLAMIVAPTEGNLKFPVKFPVSREFSDTKS